MTPIMKLVNALNAVIAALQEIAGETVHGGEWSALNVGVYLQFDSYNTDHRVDGRVACTRKGKI